MTSRSSTITTKRPGRAGLLHNPHPGEILAEEFMKPMGITQNALARAIGVPPRRINEIVLGKRAITADTDLRLCRFFGLSNGYWLRAQVAYDTEVAEEALADVLAKITPWTGTAA